MTKKDDDNPLEEIQKQLRDLMNNKNVQVAFAPFMESMKASTPEDKEEKKKSRLLQPMRRPGMNNWMQYAHLTAGLKRFVIIWIVL